MRRFVLARVQAMRRIAPKLETLISTGIMERRLKMRKCALLMMALLAGCDRASSPPPARSGGSPSTSAATPAATSGADIPKVATAVNGEAFDIRKVLVPGTVTIVEFSAPW